MGLTPRVGKDMKPFGSTLADQAPFGLPCSQPGEVLLLVKMTMPRSEAPGCCLDSDDDPEAEMPVWRLSCDRFSETLEIEGGDWAPGMNGYSVDCPSCSRGCGKGPDLIVDARSDVVYLAHEQFQDVELVKHDSTARSRSPRQVKSS